MVWRQEQLLLLSIFLSCSEDGNMYLFLAVRHLIVSKPEAYATGSFFDLAANTGRQAFQHMWQDIMSHYAAAGSGVQNGKASLFDILHVKAAMEAFHISGDGFRRIV